MLAYGFDSFRGGRAAASSRCAAAWPVRPVGAGALRGARRAAGAGADAASRGGDAGAGGGRVRACRRATTGRARSRRAAPEASEPRTPTRLGLPLVLSEGEAQAIAERLAERGADRAGRARLRAAAVGAGADAGGSRRGRGRGALSASTGSRTAACGRSRRFGSSPRSTSASRARSGGRAAGLIEAPGPVDVEFLDLPMLTGDEVPGAPHLAVTARPWTGPVAVYLGGRRLRLPARRRGAPAGGDGELARAASGGAARAVDAGLRAGPASLGQPAEPECGGGAERGQCRGDPVAGGRRRARCSSSRTAELVAPGEYRLGGFLRGQAGSDAVMPAVWPAGSRFVLLDGAVRQVPGRRAPARGVERHYRIGPATRPYDDPSYAHHVEAFAGVGLRPYRPGHLAVARRGDGAVEARWVRRTRVDGDELGRRSTCRSGRRRRPTSSGSEARDGRPREPGRRCRGFVYRSRSRSRTEPRGR